MSGNVNLWGKAEMKITAVLLAVSGVLALLTAAPVTASPCCTYKHVYYDGSGYGDSTGRHISNPYNYPAGATYALYVGPNCAAGVTAGERRAVGFSNGDGTTGPFLNLDAAPGRSVSQVVSTSRPHTVLDTMPYTDMTRRCYYHITVSRWEQSNGTGGRQA